jgi:serine/threonine protein kinase
MVMDMLGKSLEELFQLCHQKFSLKTVLMIADQAIACLEYMHRKNFVHRDVKPDNFMIGINGRARQIHIIDFGLSKKYQDPRTREHLKFAQGKSLTGTARYASVNALRGYEQSRRDDLEALGYCLLYFLRGSLPWMGLDAKDRKQKYDRIREVKENTSLEDLCNGFPNEFILYFEAVRNLSFTDRPDYEKYRGWFRELFLRTGFVYDCNYDWTDLLPPTRRFGETRPTGSVSNAAHASEKTPPDVVPEHEVLDNLVTAEEEEDLPKCMKANGRTDMRTSMPARSSTASGRGLVRPPVIPSQSRGHFGGWGTPGRMPSFTRIRGK